MFSFCFFIVSWNILVSKSVQRSFPWINRRRFQRRCYSKFDAPEAISEPETRRSCHVVDTSYWSFQAGQSGHYKMERLIDPEGRTSDASAWMEPVFRQRYVSSSLTKKWKDSSSNAMQHWSAVLHLDTTMASCILSNRVIACPVLDYGFPSLGSHFVALIQANSSTHQLRRFFLLISTVISATLVCWSLIHTPPVL